MGASRRHEANHNTIPAFQCDVEGCRKPFQRSDLLQRHLERQYVLLLSDDMDSQVLMMSIRHNAPLESPLGPSQYVRGSTSESSIHGGSLSQGSVIHSSLGQSYGLPSQSIPVTSGAMSIGSIIEPTMRHGYASPAMHTYMDSSRLPVPAAPRIPSEFIYGMSPSDSPYLSSDSSAYSPMSDFIQPQISTHSYQPTDDLPRAQSASLESTFPQHIYTSPLIATSPIPSLNFDQPPLSAPMYNSMQTSMLPSVCGMIFLSVG